MCERRNQKQTNLTTVKLLESISDIQMEIRAKWQSSGGMSFFLNIIYYHWQSAAG